jgi:hypothetical protein
VNSSMIHCKNFCKYHNVLPVPWCDNKNVKTFQKEGKREIKSVNADLYIIAGSINWNDNLGGQNFLQR